MAEGNVVKNCSKARDGIVIKFLKNGRNNHSCPETLGRADCYNECFLVPLCETKTKQGEECANPAKCSEVFRNHLNKNTFPSLNFRGNLLEIRHSIGNEQADACRRGEHPNSVPHSTEDKNRAITEAPSGIIGLETSLPVIYDVLVRENQISWLKVFCKMSTNPARLYGINAGKLAKNAIADVVVFDEKNPKVYTDSMSKSKNSPFFGKKFNGKIALTICSGKIVYRD